MATIAQNLQTLIETKNDIKDAIEGKGVSMTGVPFTGYPAKIDSITIRTAVELTQAQYDELPEYDSNTYYLIVEE